MKNNDLTKLTLLLCMVGLSVVLIMASDSSSRLGVSILFSSLFILILGLIIHHDLAVGRFDLFQPLVWLGIVFFLPNFIVKSWYNVVVEPDVHYLRKLSDLDFYLNLSMATGVLSYLCLVAGYYALPCKRQFGRMFLRYKLSAYDAWLMKWPSFIVYLLGLMLTLYLLRTGGAGYTDLQGQSSPFLYLIQLLAKYNLYGMFLFLYCLIKIKPYQDTSWNIFLAIISLSQFMLGFLMGSRSYLFLNGIIIIAVMQYTGYSKRMPRRLIWPAVLTGVLLIVGMVSITQFREIKNEQLGFEKPLDVQGAVNIYQEMGKRKTINTWAEDLKYFLENIIGRAAGMESLASVLSRADQVKEKEKSYGIDGNILKEFMWGLVPRFIYPEKPIISDFAVKFGIIYTDNPVNSRSWSSVTILGDLYRNYGYAGIGMGMFLLGMFLKAFYLITINNNKNPFLFIIYFFTTIQLNFEGTYAGPFMGNVKLWISFGVFILLVSWMYKFTLVQKIPTTRTIKT